MPYDSIIIGQGLAGSLLAYRLLTNGKKVLVIDNNHKGSSSKVAAGIINPITGTRLTTNILFNEQRNISLDLYKELENLFDQKLISELKQYRSLKSKEQMEFWLERKEQSQYYSGQSFSCLEPFINDEFEIVEIHKTLRIHTSKLLRACKKWLITNNNYLAKKIDYNLIEISENKVSIGDIQSHNIIFCEGYQVIHNPWWKHLPFKLTKGEILKIAIDKPLHAMLNWQQWLVPDSDNDKVALLGATYEWDDFVDDNACKPSAKARDYLLSQLQKNIQLEPKVLQQSAGIRPTPTHRYPYIGGHKKAANVYCFNGFASKGCQTIPYYSKLFAQHLCSGKPLPEDVTKWL